MGALLEDEVPWVQAFRGTKGLYAITELANTFILLMFQFKPRQAKSTPERILKDQDASSTCDFCLEM